MLSVWRHKPRTQPSPQQTRDPIELVGYAPESAIAEKGVTILERGITSTRWRDYVDIVTLAQAGLNQADLQAAVIEVAGYRNVRLQPIGPILDGYGKVGQAKWAAWRRKEGLEAICEEPLDDQIVRVAVVLDPVFQRQ